MIQLTCTNCRALLVMDDAFAGGVCRCKHCGTIQTVPRPSRRQSAPGSDPGATDTGQSKTLFQRPATILDAPGSGTGLDDLANVVASSGLSGTGLSGTGLQSGSLRKGPAPATPATEKRKPNYVVAGAIVGAMLAGALITWLVVRNLDQEQVATDGTPTPRVTGGSRNSTPPAVKSSSFLGEPLGGRTIVYLLDRGQGTRETFELTKLATLRSVASLPPERRFQIIFWELDTLTTGPGKAGDKELFAFPPVTPLPATPENLEAARKAIQDVNAYSQSRVTPAMTKAMAADPDEIVIATGKYGLETEVVDAVLGVRKNHRVKLRTFSLGESGSPEVMKPLAERSGGTFKQVPLFELRGFAE